MQIHALQKDKYATNVANQVILAKCASRMFKLCNKVTALSKEGNH